MEYCAASDAFTQAPSGFEEFFQQRRRWTPSTMTNIMDLLSSWRETVQRNEHVNIVYIVYQVCILMHSVYFFIVVVFLKDETFQVPFNKVLLKSRGSWNSPY